MKRVRREIRTLTDHPMVQIVGILIIGLIVWQHFPDSRDLLTGIFASMIAVIYALYLDGLTRAKLEIASIPQEEDNEEENPEFHRKFLHVNVTNPPLWNIHSWFHDRHTASGTWAEIEFYLYPDKTAQILPERIFTMPGKWRENQLPEFRKDEINSKQIRRGFKDRCDIPSGKDIPNNLDIAMKIEGDDQCYGLNLECELYRPDMRNPRRKLEGENFLVQVTLTTAGRAFRDYFELLNSNYKDFKLRDIEDVEKERIKRLPRSRQPDSASSG